MKILVIDDNQEITQPLSKFLTVKNHDCTVSNDGRNGLTLLQKQRFDVVLLDLALPEFSGYDIIDALERDDKLKESAIIVFTALALKNEEIDELKKRGIYACINKPIKLDLLLKTIEGIKDVPV